MPVNDTSSAVKGLQKLAEEHSDISRGSIVLDVLRCVFQSMGDRPASANPWLQNPATPQAHQLLQ